MRLLKVSSRPGMRPQDLDLQSSGIQTAKKGKIRRREKRFTYEKFGWWRVPFLTDGNMNMCLCFAEKKQKRMVEFRQNTGKVTLRKMRGWWTWTCVCWQRRRQKEKETPVDVECSLLVLITNLTRLKPLYDEPSSSKRPAYGRAIRDDDKDNARHLDDSSVDKVSMATYASPRI